MFTNVVRGEKYKKIQSETLGVLADAVECSFGPKASNTNVSKENMSMYTKDGFTILESVQFLDCIESATKKDVIDILRYIKTKYGDGSSSAAILIKLLFDKFYELSKEEKYLPFDIIRTFQKVVDEIKDEIMKRKEEFSPDMAYEITYIATNGNVKIAEEVKSLYERFGNDVFVEVTTSLNENSYIKIFDGLTLDSGVDDVCFFSDSKKQSADLNHPEVYAFYDPIDTPEMINLLKAIIAKNIQMPYASKQANVTPTPTIILAPKIGRDAEGYMNMLAEWLLAFPDGYRPQLAIVSNITSTGLYEVIAKLCGCKWIRKYISNEALEEAKKANEAPTIDNVYMFAGHAEQVKTDADKTVFVNPEKMWKKYEADDDQGHKKGDFIINEYGTKVPSDAYNSQINFFESGIKQAQLNNKDANVVGRLKRYLHSIKANMIEYQVGGVSIADRDSLSVLIKDAIKSTRSAAEFGVGQGANIEGLLASRIIAEKYSNNEELECAIATIIADSYYELVYKLYRSTFSDVEADAKVAKSIRLKTACNLRNEEFDGTVKSSIMSDIVILDTITKVLSVMVTANQFLCPDASHNVYEAAQVCER